MYVSRTHLHGIKSSSESDEKFCQTRDPLFHGSIDSDSDTQYQIGVYLISEACSEVIIGSVSWSCNAPGTDLIDFLSITCSMGVSD